MKFKVRILDDKKVDIKETREVSFESYRLTYGLKLAIRSKAEIMSYAEMDVDEYQKSINAKSKKGKDKPLPIKDIRMGEWQTAKYKAEAEACKLVFGLNDVSLDNIVSEDFDQLMDFIADKDLLGTRKTDKDALEGKVKRD
jgi:hypothetical protein